MSTRVPGMRCSPTAERSKEKIVRSRRRRTVRSYLVIGALAATVQLACADSDYASDWGPSIGSTAPLLAATDQAGKTQTLETMAGPKGLLFLFNRSADW